MRKTVLSCLVCLLALLAAAPQARGQNPPGGALRLAVIIRDGGGVAGTIGADTVDRWYTSHTLYFPRGTRVPYSLRVAPGFAFLNVEVAAGTIGKPTRNEASGTIVMDQDYTLTAIALRPMALVRQNRVLYDAYVAGARAGDPASQMPRILEAMSCMQDWYGPMGGMELIAGAEDAARDSLGKTEGWKRFQSVLMVRRPSYATSTLLSNPCHLAAPADALPAHALDASPKSIAPTGPYLPKPRPESLMVTLFYRTGAIRGIVGTDSVGREGQTRGVNVARGATVRYAFTLMPGYTNLGVSLDGKDAPVSGTIVADTTHLLGIIASHKPFVDPRNRVLYDLNLRMAQDTAPERLVRRMMSELECLKNWYGPSLSEDLVDGATRAAIDAVKVKDTVAMKRTNARMEKAMSGLGMLLLINPPKCDRGRPPH